MKYTVFWRTIVPLILAVSSTGCDYTNPGTPTRTRVPQEVVAARSASQLASKERAGGPKQILFGDLHVHTTFSIDAFMFSLPSQSGTGAHPPADACDFARFCSNLDFFSFNDHAEGLLQDHWREIKETTRTCNALAGPPDNPDLVVFPGWEWTQMTDEPTNYYGHKNVIFRDIEEDRLPARPISSRDPQQPLLLGVATPQALLWGALFDPLHASSFLRFRSYLLDLQEAQLCPSGVDTRKLPLDCLEGAPDP